MIKSRTYMTRLNLYASMVNRIITLACSFVGRTYFIHCLNTEYLGIGGMFGNVLSVISLCELGIYEAVSQGMYKPLAKRDFYEIKGIIRDFSVAYRYVSLATLTISIGFMPMLPYVFPDVVKIDSFRLIYVLFVINQLVGYYYAPKKALVISDQRAFVVMYVRTVSSVLVTLAQVFLLIYTKNYIFTLVVRVIFQIVEGAVIEAYANKKYQIGGSLKCFSASSNQKSIIKQNTKALLLHRIGGVINNSTDSILLSSVLGLSHMGVYSNYALIINSLGTFIALGISSAAASIGNLGTEEDSQKSEIILTKLTFCNFYMLTVCSSVLLVCINPFIALWIGDNMCFNAYEAGIIILCFFMSYVRDPVQIFLRNYGVFKSTRFIPVTRGLLNLVLSYAFVKSLGVVGVFAGTAISTLLVPFILEPYMLFKHGFKSDGSAFIKKYVGYLFNGVVICGGCYFLCSLVDGNIIAMGVLSFVVANILLLVFYGGTNEFKTIVDMVIKRKKVC